MTKKATPEPFTTTVGILNPTPGIIRVTIDADTDDEQEYLFAAGESVDVYVEHFARVLREHPELQPEAS